MEKRIRFLYAALGHPAALTLMKIIKLGFLSTWPELTEENVRKSLRAPDATLFGRMHQQRRNELSTKSAALNEEEEQTVQE